ncbi:class I SAM-dependent methyltransferase [Sphingomonas sp. SUN019]|uniref:class I SAM-dependent methyltransferase n=1 Tax=Sphingomonas sp. SUN019 TaxID=2937788 RepID=UPI0021643CAB|nr:class I SAM-dependent methyltransferase [Sphingomonas sp. SUN019]UVO48991.1 class I SAM-dependent methyltransferase [Sphingomonas sp. SUN019]
MTEAPVRPVRRGEIATAIDAVAVQISSSTKLNRYPAVFQAVQQLCRAGGIARPHILSFGSSSGEEAHTLSTQYFAGSPILGLEVAEDVLAQSRESYGANPDLRFEKSGVYEPEPESFDVIFAMSVLCRWPETRNMTDIAQLFPFANFEKQTAYLDSLLKPGGIMVIYNASYGFLHSRTSRHYDLIAHPRITTAGFVKRFRKDGGEDPSVAPTDCVYRKQQANERIGARGLVIRDHALKPIAVIERDIAIG